MKIRKLATSVVIVVVMSTAAATPARATSICDINPDTSYYSWFAHAFGYCN